MYPNEYSETCVCGAGMTAQGTVSFIRMQRESFHFRHKDCSSTPVPGSSRMAIHPLYAGGSVGMPPVVLETRCAKCNTDQKNNPYPQWQVSGLGRHYCIRCATEMD